MLSLLFLSPALHCGQTVSIFCNLSYPPFVRLYQIVPSCLVHEENQGLQCPALLQGLTELWCSHSFPFSQLCLCDCSISGEPLCPQNSPQYPVKTLGEQIFSDVVNWCYSGALGISISCRSDHELDLVMMDPDVTPSKPCPPFSGAGFIP